MSSELPHNWQIELMKEIEDVEHKMDDARERISKNPRIITDHVKALESVRKAKDDVAYFIGVYNDEANK
jgi:hypothetical protein